MLFYLVTSPLLIRLLLYRMFSAELLIVSGGAGQYVLMLSVGVSVVVASSVLVDFAFVHLVFVLRWIALVSG